MSAPPVTRPADRVPFLLLTAATAIYIALRITLVPWVHDEARAYQVMVLPRDYMLLTGPWEVGNHFLQTLMMVAGDALGGASHWSLRGWSLLAFLLFARYAWAMGAWVQEPAVRWCLWVALLLAPFQLDFFGLARGYAWGNTFLLMALFHTVRFTATGRTGQLLLGLCGLQGMVYSVLSLLVPALVLGGVLLVSALRRSGDERRLAHVLWLVAAGLVPAVPAVLFGLGLSERGMLYAGSAEGFLAGTVGSLGEVMFPWHGDLVAYGISGIVLGCAALVGRQAFTQRRMEGPGVLVAIAIVGSALGFVVLHQLRGVLFPVDRSALAFVPLALLTMALAWDQLAAAERTWRHGAWVLLVLPVGTLFTLNLSRTLLWPEQATPAMFRQLVHDMGRTMDRPVMVGAQKFLGQTWSLENMRAAEPLNELDVQGFPHDQCDLLLIDTTTYDVPAGFRVNAAAPGGRNVLMRRDPPLGTRVVLDSSIAGAHRLDEFRTLWQAPVTEWYGRSAFVETWMDLSTEQPISDTWLVLEVTDTTGAHWWYDAVELDHVRGRRKEGTVHLAKRLPPIPRSARGFALYLYNPRHVEVTMSNARVRIHEVLPT